MCGACPEEGVRCCNFARCITLSSGFLSAVEFSTQQQWSETLHLLNKTVFSIVKVPDTLSEALPRNKRFVAYR